MAKARPLEIGTRIGPYVVRDVLGRGSQGVVYLARREAPAPEEVPAAASEAEAAPSEAADAEAASPPPEAPPPEDVALKVVRGDADPSARDRFVREAETTRGLRHEGIVRVLDHGEDADGRLWYAMERVEATTLESRILSRGPLLPTDAARLVMRLAGAVHYAHERGVVHRDLKPGNVLLEQGDLERPKIADFGLALIEGGSRLTQTGAFVGTPCYMAPEIVRGERAGPASDVYALGAILYECLVGRPPFIGGSIGAILEQTLEARPIPPRRLRDRIPAALERVCFHCLEKAPAHRPPSAASVARALSRFLGEGGEAAAPGEGVALLKVGARRAWPWLVGLLLGLEVGFLLGLWLVTAMRR